MTKSNPVPPADDVIQQVAQAQDLTFLALAPRSNLVYLVGEMASHITGLTAKCFLPSLYAATDCLLGPVQFDFVTEVDAFGRPRNVAHNVSSYQGVLIAPTGCAKTTMINIGPRALGASTSSLRKSKYSVFRKQIMHIPICKDGTTPTMLADGSAAFKFRVLEQNPKVFVFGEFVDEADGQLNRWESAGLLDIATELSQWNTGLRVGKNDGATSGNREHLKVSRAMNLQPFQALRLISLDLGSSGEDDGSGRNLGIPARNLLTLGFKVGSSAEAITETINEYDFQAHIDKLFRSAGSSSAGNIDGPMQDLANKLVLGAKLCSTTFPSYLTTVFSVELEAFRSRNMTLSADDGRAVTAEAEAARVARALEQRAGVGEPDSDVEDEEETVAVKRYKSIDGQKVEIDPPLSPEEQSALWKAALRRMVPARETGPALARTWNGYDISGDKLRSSKPVMAGIHKKCKEHLSKVMPTTFFLEFGAYILRMPTLAGGIDLLSIPIGSDTWNLEFKGRVNNLSEPEIERLGIEYLFDPFRGEPMACANPISVEITTLLVAQSVEGFELFLSPKAPGEPSWCALLHYKAPMLIARSVKDVRCATSNNGKLDTPTFEATAAALEEAGLGYYVRVARCTVVPGGKLGDGPYEVKSGTPTPFFLKLLEYNEETSGNLSRAGSSIDLMNAVETAISSKPALERGGGGTEEAAKMLMGLASMTDCLHLLSGDSTFKRVLVDAHTGRIGTKEAYTSATSLHKHLMQLVIKLRISQGHDLTLDPTDRKSVV